MIVIEFWKENADSQQQTVTYAKDTYDEIMASYHYVLYQATTSSHFKHGAVVLDDDGRVVVRECYQHAVKEEENA